jgi:hypothetical protein
MEDYIATLREKLEEIKRDGKTLNTRRQRYTVAVQGMERQITSTMALQPTSNPFVELYRWARSTSYSKLESNKESVLAEGTAMKGELATLLKAATAGDIKALLEIVSEIQTAMSKVPYAGDYNMDSVEEALKAAWVRKVGDWDSKTKQIHDRKLQRMPRSNLTEQKKPEN